MSEHSDLLAEGGSVQWEREVRGYNRQQVDEYVAWRAGQIRELEGKLTAGLDENELLRRELTEARQAGGRPAHEEVSERVGQILKLAADEAKAERERGAAEIGKLRELAKHETDKLRADVKEETDRLRAEAQDRAERMLAAAHEQAERSVAAAGAEAEKLVSTSQAASDRALTDATKHAESTVAAAMAQSKQQLDEATARATAIHDGAERRLNLLISRHTETVRRLTEIRDVVTSLVSGETARGSLEDEVARALGTQPAANGAEGRTSGQHDAAQAGAHRGGHRQAGAPGQAGPVDGRRAQVPQAGASGQPGSRDRDQSDPLTAERRDGADSVKQPSDPPRHPSHAAPSSPGAPDRVLDETGAGGRSIDS